MRGSDRLTSIRRPLRGGFVSENATGAAGGLGIAGLLFLNIISNNDLRRLNRRVALGLEGGQQLAEAAPLSCS